MPGCSKQRNPKGIEITFEEDTHKYSSIIDGKEITYVSGTTFVDRFFPKFDPDGKIAERTALKEGVTKEAIQKKWRDKGIRSCKFGTKIHETVEDVLLGNMLRNKPEDEKERKTMEVAVRVGKKILDKTEILGVEKIVFDSDIRIAGTMDLFVRAKKDGKLWILDHKTNEKIQTYNQWRKFALPPIEHLADTNYIHYSLQLNLYENILKRAGYIDPNEKVEKALFHMTVDGNKTYRLSSFQTDIENMIDWHLTHPKVNMNEMRSI